MERLSVSANKSNLLRLKEELSFAAEGMELLDQKKEALVARISALSSRAETVRAELNKALDRSYGYLRKALLIHGHPACQRASLAVSLGEDVEIREKTFMGVPLSQVRIELPKLVPAYGFYGTGVAMDYVAKTMYESMETMAELAEIEVRLFRLVAEIRKTIKRLNALENIHIPVYQATIKHIEESLEEKERESLFQLKRKKSRPPVPL